MALDWAVAALLDAQKNFRRVKHAGMREFMGALESGVSSKFDGQT